jgi:hypothetical protein
MSKKMEGKRGKMGGARPGAGRPKGYVQRWKESSLFNILGAAQKDELPLDFMLRVMRHPKTPTPVAIEIAKSAAPYMHHKLASVTHSGDPNNPVSIVNRIERVFVDSPSPDNWKDITDTDSESLPALDQLG